MSNIVERTTKDEALFGLWNNSEKLPSVFILVEQPNGKFSLFDRVNFDFIILNMDNKDIKTLKKTEIDRNSIMDWDVALSLTEVARGKLKSTRIQMLCVPGFKCHKNFCGNCMCNH